MSEHYPRIRPGAESGYLLFREGLNLSFYMRRAHVEVASAVMRALEVYLRATGPQVLGQYANDEGYWLPLDAAGWETTRRDFFETQGTVVHLIEPEGREMRYGFEYYGKPLHAPSWSNETRAVSAVSFWLPTEFLEQHGPAWVRELAVELATLLPFCSGHAGLAFHGELNLLGVMPEVQKYCFRYPGLDIPYLGSISQALGPRVRGISWLNFLGQPVLGELGGASALRARLHSPGTSVQELEGERAVVTLGAWPEAGDTQRGEQLPAYRELARVLEPWLFFEERGFHPDFPPEVKRRWERRFLD